MSRSRARIADALGLLLILLALCDFLRPSLLLLPTIAAGGDTPCHYPTAVWFQEQLLPRLRLHGWYPGAYLGQPLLLYYFPLPFLLMSALAPLTGMPVAFKLGTALGVFLLPPLTWLSFRLMGFRFPAPLMGATAALVFLLVEDNPIWGGTLASTLTGEFSYTYGIGLGTLFLGCVYRAYSRGERPLLPGALLAVTALAHGYAVLWAGLSASYFLYGSRRPARTLLWLLAVAALAFALAGAWLLPLLADWGWTTPYDDPWLTVALKNLFPPLLWPLFALAALGLLGTLVWGRSAGGPDRRLLFLLHSALVGAALAAAGPALGIIDVRFVPFAQLAAALAGAAALGLVLESFAAAADLAALGVLLLAIAFGDASSKVLRFWVDWNYTGVEMKEGWPAFHAAMDRLRGGVSDPRVAVEYSQEHEKAGSIRVYETLPYFSGRSTLEGVYNQASLNTHAVYYLASELDAVSPNPFRKREYSSFDTDNALRHLRLFHVSDVVAVSEKLRGALEARSDVVPLGRVPPFSLFRLVDPGRGYVEPLAFAPVRSSPLGWREKSYRWFTRKPLSPAHLVFTDDPRFGTVEPDEWLAPPQVPLPDDVVVTEQVSAEEVRIHTSRPGHPLLVKISYHPRWKAEGADGPFLASPALMLVVPRQGDVRLRYSRGLSDALGLLLSVGGLVVVALGLVPRRAAPGGAPLPLPILLAVAEHQPAQRRWGGLLPAALLLLLVSGRLLVLPPDPTAQGRELHERASQAYAQGRYADAAEYARHAERNTKDGAGRAELICLRAESLLKDGRSLEAAEAFDRLVREFAESPYIPEALYGLAEARAAAGDAAAAAQARTRLLEDHGDTPWAARLRQP